MSVLFRDCVLSVPLDGTVSSVAECYCQPGQRWLAVQLDTRTILIGQRGRQYWIAPKENQRCLLYTTSSCLSTYFCADFTKVFSSVYQLSYVQRSQLLKKYFLEFCPNSYAKKT